MRIISSRRVIQTSFLVDLSDLVLNLVVAGLSGSAVMLSQAFQGAADLVTSGLLMIGLNRSRQRADRNHDFGYGRELYFWILMAGITMFLVTAVSSVVIGWRRLLAPQAIDNLWLASLTLFIGVGTNFYAFYLSWQRLRRSDKQGTIFKVFVSSNLIETKATLTLDLMGGLASILGLIAYGIYFVTGDARFDGLGAIVIGLATGLAALFLMNDVKDFLVGRSMPVELEVAARQAALSVSGVEAILGLKSMYFGAEELFVNLDIHVADGRTTEMIERLIENIKAKVKQEVPAIRHLQIELNRD